MLRILVFSSCLALSGVAPFAQAQTASERPGGLPPAPAVLASGSAEHTWPAPGSLTGRSLQLEVAGENSHASCRLREFTADHVYCRLPRNRTLSFERSEVLHIQHEPDGSAMLNFGAAASFYTGLSFLTFSASCAADGAPVCRKPGAIGVSLLGTSGVLKIVEVYRKRHARLIYSAP